MSAHEHHEYVPGDWTAVLGDGLVAVVEPGTAAATVDGLWQVARDGGGVLAALGVLAAGGFADLPDFVVVDVSAGGDVHAVLRGDVRLTVPGAEGVQEVEAQPGAVWTEHRASTTGGATVRVAGAGSPGQVRWPVRSGVVRAASVLLAGPGGATGTGAQGRTADAAGSPAGAAPGALRERRGSGRAARSEASIAAATLGAPVVAPVPGPAATVPDPTDGYAPDLVPDAVPVPDEVPVLDPAPGASGTTTPWWAGDDGAPAADPVPVPPAPAGGGGTPAVPGLEPVDDEPFVLTPADVPTPAVADVPMIRVGTHQPGDDDHDGMTILSSDLAQIRDQLPTWSQDAVPGPFLAPVPVPLSARLVLSTGLVVPLDRSVLLGRAPQVARVTNRELPRLVTVPSPNQDISRTHAEVRVDGEHVVVTDLDSTNGVHVSRAGDGVRRLHPGEPSVVATDEVVDLGDGVTFTVERTT